MSLERPSSVLRPLAVALGLSAAASVVADEVVINEIHYAPPDKTVPEEFIELHNPGSAPVDLSGWFLSGGIRFVFPDGTAIEPGGYVVVAEDPEILEGMTGATGVLGPYDGRLSNDGERIVLRNGRGTIEDEVEYSDRFPWPMACDREGASMELLHPGLDNRVGGHWRASGLVGSVPTERRFVIPRAASGWRYRKGLSEASDPPSAWREPGFVEDDTWLTGQAPVGFGDDDDNTVLDDMLGNYSSVYLRRTFTIAPGDAIPTALRLLHYVDDGFVLWINGRELARVRVPPEGEIPFDGLALNTTEARWRPAALPNPSGFLREGENVVAVHALNQRATSNDFSIDIELFVPGPEDLQGIEDLVALPTPGARNTVYSQKSPPAVLRVEHAPAAPAPGELVLISVAVSDPDGVAGVELEYQIVEPGRYVPLGDSAYELGWEKTGMDRAGRDPETGGELFLGAIPPDVQAHRRLVRYRVTATDRVGDAVRVPYLDDPQPNFAWFVYGGVPAWRGRSRPGAPVREFSEEVMRSLPVYHLIARQSDVINCQYNPSFENRHFLGTMVYEGAVYDHIEFEVRGEFSTYVSGKNKWRFFFHRGHEFRARDDFGRRYRTRWRKMNVSALATPWVPTNRGMAGLDEGLSFKVYGLAGVPSPKTNFFHFRIIDEPEEAHPTDQHRGDLWGLYMTIEHTDGRFLDERGLPDGNTYKIESGAGDKRNQGPTHPLNSSDFIRLRSGYSRPQPVEWWRANVELDVYFSFRSVNRAVNNMDLREGWNICQYHNPDTGRWSVIPWDLDMLYMPLTHWSGVMDFQNSLQHRELRTEYQNRGRELRDLLFTPDQFEPLVDEFASFANPPGEEPTFVDVDEAMWNFHPRTAGNHRGAFYRNPSTHGARGGTITRTLVSADHEGMAQWAKDFVLRGYGANFLRRETQNASVPATPQVTAVADPGFPTDGLVFRSSPFSDPQGDDTFGGMEWRIAEVTPPGAVRPGVPRLWEIDAVWESGELDEFLETMEIPAHVARPGATYRVRARHRDDAGGWSHWSEPVEFVTGPPRATVPQEASLRVTELMYHPGDGDLEFIELQNVGPGWIDLRHVAFTRGVEFRFETGDVSGLRPGEMTVVVRDRAVFETVYRDVPGILIAGEYSGRLENRGERVTLRWGAGVPLLDFVYDDAWYPETDGGGRSLVIRDPGDRASRWSEKGGWRPSSADGGSPGRDDPPLAPGLRLPGDLSGNGRLEVTDAVLLLRHLFGGANRTLPCEGSTIADGANRVLADLDGDGRVNLTDAVGLLRYLFLGGPPPVAGVTCVPIDGCPEACAASP